MNATSALGWALLHFLWQGTLIALLARLGLAMLPARLASWRYLVAVAALAVMPATVLFSTWSRMQAPVSVERAAFSPPAGRSLESPTGSGGKGPVAVTRAPSSPTTPAISPPTAPSPPTSASWRQRIDGALPWIVGVWASGALALSVRLLAGYFATRRLVRGRDEPAPEAVNTVLARLTARLGVRRAVRVCSSSLTRVPAVVGWICPVVLLPASAVTGLSLSQLEAILAHELAHVRRHDYLVNMLQSIIETLLFYHPLVWWLGARIREEREHCCDDLAVAACGSAPVYAQALLSMERLRGVPEPALGFTGGSLLARVERLLAPRPRGMDMFPRWMAGMSAAAIVLLFVATSDLAKAAPASRQRDQAQADREPTGVGAVHIAPDPSLPLASGYDWARDEASRRGYREYWIGHSIPPLPAFDEGILLGSFERNGGLVMENGDEHYTFTGRVKSTAITDGMRLAGDPLAPLVNADPKDVGVLYLYSARSGRPVIRRTHLATASLAVDFEGLPLLWLGRAEDAESARDALARMDQVKTKQLRADLIGILGAHATSAIVVPELTGILASTSREDELRVEAAEWLSCHPVMEALEALDGAARSDRSADVRRKAAESVGEMRFAPAFEVLVALAHELTDDEARREAVEGFGGRTEPQAASVLVELAGNDPDEDVQREAVETLGELPGGAGRSALATILHGHPNQEVRREAVETYGECAPTEDAIALLRELVAKDPDSDVRREAVETLGELPDKQVVGILTGFIDGKNDLEVQMEAVETLGETVAGAAVAPELERIARGHPVTEVQREAVETLGDLSDKDSHLRDILIALATDHPSEDVRAEAVETLADHPTAGSASLFQRLLDKEQSPLVREELKDALEEL